SRSSGRSPWVASGREQGELAAKLIAWVVLVDIGALRWLVSGARVGGYGAGGLG
ncbi:hypothetical protein HMPREF0072_0605, partial [Anaerococcus lactolyticus ATCC 51172]